MFAVSCIRVLQVSLHLFPAGSTPRQQHARTKRAPGLWPAVFVSVAGSTGVQDSWGTAPFMLKGDVLRRFTDRSAYVRPLYPLFVLPSNVVRATAQVAVAVALLGLAR